MVRGHVRRQHQQQLRREKEGLKVKRTKKSYLTVHAQDLRYFRHNIFRWRSVSVQRTKGRLGAPWLEGGREGGRELVQHSTRQLFCDVTRLGMARLGETWSGEITGET